MATKLAPGLSMEVRYRRFIETCSDPNHEPVQVFYPLSPKQLADIELIRELSVELRKKKDKDIQKASERIAATVDTRVTEKEGENTEETEVSKEKASE